MAEYVEAPIVVDPDDLKQLAVDHLQARIPGWEPAVGNLDYWLIEAVAEIAAQVAEAAAERPPGLFREFGEKLVGVAATPAAEATGSVTVTAIDTAGHTLPAGSMVDFEGADGDAVAFQLQDDAVIAPGASSVSGVTVVAVEPGEAGNGATGSGVLIDAVDWIASVTLAAATTGGSDAEDPEVYEDRLADELRLLSPRPILAEDFAVLARRVPAVAAALAIDGYDPGTDTYANERMVTVAVRDAAGDPVGPTAKAAVQALLDAEREVNFVVHVVDPNYSTIDVAFSVDVWPGDFVAADVVAAAEAAVEDFLSPATWGQPAYGEDRRWADEPKVRYLKLAQVIGDVEGVRHLVSLSVNGGTADVTLTGPAGLPQAGTIAGSVAP